VIELSHRPVKSSLVAVAALVFAAVPAPADDAEVGRELREVRVTLQEMQATLERLLVALHGSNDVAYLDTLHRRERQLREELTAALERRREIEEAVAEANQAISAQRGMKGEMRELFEDQVEREIEALSRRVARDVGVLEELDVRIEELEAELFDVGERLVRVAARIEGRTADAGGVVGDSVVGDEAAVPPRE
jgi:chromosome segregation ATPase